MKKKIILFFVCIFFSFVDCITLGKSPKTTLENSNSTLPKSLNILKTDNFTNFYLSSFTKYDLIIFNDVADDYENEHKIKNALKKIQDDSFNLTDFYQYLLFKVENKDLIGSYIYLTYKNYTFSIKKSSSSFLSEVLKEQGSIDIISIMKYFISREPLGEGAKIKNNQIVMQTPFRFSQRDQTIWNDIGYNTPDKDYYKIGSTQTNWKGMFYVEPIKHYYGFTYRLSKEQTLLNSFNCWGFALGIPQFLLPLQQITPTLIRFQVGLNRGELANMINLYAEFFKNHPTLKTILNYDKNCLIQQAIKRPIHPNDLHFFINEPIRCSIESEVVVFYFKNQKLTHASKKIKYTNLYISKLGKGPLSIHPININVDIYGQPKLFWCSKY